MSGDFLLIRHARAMGQAPDAPLTPEGEEQARRLAQVLAALNIAWIVSSPWERAIETARPLADALNLLIVEDERLTERVLSSEDLADWQTHLRASFLDSSLYLPGGESGATAKARALAALEDAQNPDGLTAVFTHGNLLALLLGLDYDGWAGLKSPDVWCFSLDGPASRIPLE